MQFSRILELLNAGIFGLLAFEPCQTAWFLHVALKPIGWRQVHYSVRPSTRAFDHVTGKLCFRPGETSDQR